MLPAFRDVLVFSAVPAAPRRAIICRASTSLALLTSLSLPCLAASFYCWTVPSLIKPLCAAPRRAAPRLATPDSAAASRRPCNSFSKLSLPRLCLFCVLCTLTSLARHSASCRTVLGLPSHRAPMNCTFKVTGQAYFSRLYIVIVTRTVCSVHKVSDS